jgi:hypothetical protein
MKAIPLRALLFFIALWASPAHAGEVAVTGHLGYMSEWELAGTVQTTGTGQTEFAGPLVAKHVGVCMPNGAVEKSGEIRFRRTGLLSSRIEGVVTLWDEPCTFEARESTHEGVMKCPGKGGVPLTLQVE